MFVCLIFLKLCSYLFKSFFLFLLIRHERSNGCALLHLNCSSWIIVRFMSCHVIHLDFKKIHPENQRLLELKTEIEAKKTQQPSVKKADIETTVVSKVIEKTNHTCAAHWGNEDLFFGLTPREKFSNIFSRSYPVWLIVFVLFCFVFVCLFVCLFYKRFTSKMNIMCMLRLELHTLHKVILWHVLNSVNILLFRHEDLTEF